MCTNTEFEIKNRQNLINSPAAYRLSQVQAELESRSVSDYLNEPLTPLYNTLHKAGLNLSFQEEEFRDCDNLVIIVSRAEIRDSISPENNLVATGCGFSVTANPESYAYLDMCSFDDFKVKITETRKSALSQLFPVLLLSDEAVGDFLSRACPNTPLEQESGVEQESDDIKAEEENSTQDNRSEFDKAMDLLDELEF